jgi:hypothetical protein
MLQYFVILIGNQILLFTAAIVTIMIIFISDVSLSFYQGVELLFRLILHDLINYWINYMDMEFKCITRRRNVYIKFFKSLINCESPKFQV